MIDIDDQNHKEVYGKVFGKTLKLQKNSMLQIIVYALSINQAYVQNSGRLGLQILGSQPGNGAPLPAVPGDKPDLQGCEDRQLCPHRLNALQSGGR